MQENAVVVKHEYEPQSKLRGIIPSKFDKDIIYE